MAANKHHAHTLSFAARAALPSCPALSSYLLTLMSLKRTNLCLSADVSTSAELLAMAEEVGDYICILKVHADIVNDFTDRTIRHLKDIAGRKHFLVFEDRKFGDIGSTVQKQYLGGSLGIAKWAEIVTAHVFPGPAVITTLKQAAADCIAQYNTTVHTEITSGINDEDQDTRDEIARILSPPSRFNSNRGGGGANVGRDVSPAASDSDKLNTDPRDARKQSVVSISTTISTRSEPLSPQPTTFSSHLARSSNMDDSYGRLGPVPYLRAVLLLAQMSSEGNLLDDAYTSHCVQLARQHPEFVMGFVAQRSLNAEPTDNFITFTPGVQLVGDGAARSDGLGQRYRTPSDVVLRDGADVVIVGRGILNADNRVGMAERYRKEAWSAYEARIAAQP